MLSQPSFSEIYQNLLTCYDLCQKNKPHIKQSEFHLDYEYEIYRLAGDIYHQRYTPQVSSICLVFHPKPREIIAASIADRVVHHFIYSYTNPYWERRFVPNSYACCTGKGPINAMKDVRNFIRSHARHGGRSLYTLKIDVASFFPSIDLKILKRIIFNKLKHPLYKYLVERVLTHRATDEGNYIQKSPQEFWTQIPAHKSMFNAPRDKGRPIGNLTSQFFANIYMNEVDQFISHKIKGILYWQRYVDDLLFLSDNIETLRGLPKMINDFLLSELEIKLNPSKTILQPIDRGFDHLGYWMKPNYTLVRRKNVIACRSKLKSKEMDSNSSHRRAIRNSYLGLFKHGDCYGLSESIKK